MGNLSTELLMELEAAFARIAEKCIPDPQPGVEQVIKEASFMTSVLLTRISEHNDKLVEYRENSAFCGRLAESFKSRLARGRNIIFGLESLGLRQRRALWIVDAASSRPEYQQSPKGGVILLMEIALHAAHRPPEVLRFKAIAELASRVMAVWATSGGKENAKKWALVQELFEELKIGAASPNALKALWKQERAEARRESKPGATTANAGGEADPVD